ncbi:Glutathione-regulated potassium-efflux system protein [Candidatus Bealeia paramacronuclearis]|uniref:Glutathione-regulated potassium-efflux system protein n=1 Tax=Candidatus Bealeia paramacronuclearis TaxID=1921001 RepID=A0ABZ2C0X1_9PROT|nr:Glutathione-regulated potassium-efflux system protein [Candidatus Bealeia paramacronuclearis]
MLDQPGYLDNILVFLIAAVGVVFIFRRMKASPVLGYLVAGMLIGPSVLGLIRDVNEARFLGELGVIVMLFSIGLELPWQRLQSLRKYVFGLGISQVLVTAFVMISVALLFGFAPKAAILVGSALALSSTAIVLQVLSERKELGARSGRAAFAVLLLQDLAVVLLLVIIATFGKNEESVWIQLLFSFLKAILALVLIVFLGRIVFRPLYRVMASTGNPELFMATTFLVLLGTSFFTEVAGLSLELGAFLAGILLAETEYRHQIEADIEPFRGLLLGVFFMSVGMGIHVETLLSNFALVVTVLFSLLLVKAVILFFLCRVFGLRTSTAIRVALLLAGGGEFVFVIFSPDVIHNFLSQGVADVLFVVVGLSMALTPLLSTFGKKLAMFFEVSEVKADVKQAPQEVAELSGHVIIAGYGRVGQMVGDMLSERLIPYVAIDNDMRRVTEGRLKGLPVFFGDARRLEVLRAIGAESASAAVVTLKQMTSSVRTVMTIRRHFPEIPICVRIRDQQHYEKLSNSGALLVVPETLEPSLQLASEVLRAVGTPSDETFKIVEAYRRQQLHLQEGGS